jgi:putative methyltransferase
LKNVYFVQVDISSNLGTKSAYLPYTAGILVANAWESEIVKKNCSFKEFIFLRENIDSVLERMDNPGIAAFSNYCWSTEYNKALARKIKEKYPDCITVFGGHNVPNDNSFLEQFDYIDILVHGEGEDTIKQLFEVICEGGDFSTVPNISYRNGKNECLRTESTCAKALDYPSPYLDGWFDDIIRQHPEIEFNAIIETSRGCPNQCAYCDWGLLKSKVRLFPMDRVLAEIKWFSDHKIAFVWGADANFGMFTRDLEIADAFVEAKETTGYPERVRINYAKNNFKNVFAIVKKFKECELDRVGATLSFQSLSPVVLENIGRRNSDLEFYKNLLTEYNKEGMKAYSELILGLPGETYESFIKGIGTLFEIGQHFVFEVYGCILLPNSMMGQKEYMKKHGIKTVRTEIIRRSDLSEQSIPEYNEIIVETNSMSREMWIRSMTFAQLTRAFHASGLLRAFAIYLYCEKGVPYEKFYDGIIDYFDDNPDLFTSKLFFDVRKYMKEQNDGGNTTRLTFAPCKGAIWEGSEYMVLHILEKIDRFFEDMLPYLKKFNIADDIFNDLISYQKNILRKPEEEENVITLHYDIHKFLTDVYINQIHPLERKDHTLVLRDSHPQPNWVEFGKYVIWYGKLGWASYKDDVKALPAEAAEKSDKD